MADDPLRLRFGRFVDDAGEMIDEVTAVYMPHGRSYTGLEQVEIFCHGGYQIVRSIQKVLIEAGARAAEPGEFTRLAFLNGRIDLAQAEAVADLIAAHTERSTEVAREHLAGAYSEHVGSMRQKVVSVLAEIEAGIDYPEEGIEEADNHRLAASLERLQLELQALAGTYSGGQILREGFRLVIAGRPNAGKSSLFNLLLKRQRALVMDSPGTTRDYLSEWIDLDGIAVNLIDTAGLRDGGEAVEMAGQAQARELAGSADLVLWLVDLSDPSWRDLLEHDIKDLNSTTIMLVGNKIDLISEQQIAAMEEIRVGSACLSCTTGDGFSELMKVLASFMANALPDLTQGAIVTSARHQQKLALAAESTAAAIAELSRGSELELVAFELRQAMSAIDEITGRIYNEEILAEVFSRFCVGK